MQRIATTICGFSLAAAGAAGLAITTGTGAQPEGGQPSMEEMMQAWAEAGRITDEHRALWAMEGEWEFEATFIMDDQEFTSTGTATNERIFEGRFLRMEIDGQMDQGPWQGIGYTGFNNVTGQYQTIWMDSMSTLIMASEGSRSDENTWVYWGEHENPMGPGKVRGREVIEVTGDDSFELTFYEAYPGETEMRESGSISFTRAGD